MGNDIIDYNIFDSEGIFSLFSIIESTCYKVNFPFTISLDGSELILTNYTELEDLSKDLINNNQDSQVEIECSHCQENKQQLILML